MILILSLVRCITYTPSKTTLSDSIVRVFGILIFLLTKWSSSKTGIGSTMYDAVPFVSNCTYPCRPSSLLFVHPGKFPHVFLGRSLLARISQHNSSLAPRNQQCRAFDREFAHRTTRVRVIMSMNDAAIEAQESAARELAKLLPSPDLLSNLARIRADYAARQQVRPSSVRHPR